MKTFYMVNLGCKVNAYECDAIANMLEDNGYTLSEEKPLPKSSIHTGKPRSWKQKVKRNQQSFVQRLISSLLFSVQKLKRKR